MLFNSLDFGIFLPIVFFLYWFVFNSNLKIQNALIVVASYVFYGWWDWRFLSLIAFSTTVDYLVGQKLRYEDQQYKRKLFLWISIIINIGFLGFFKYYNFFLENFVQAFSFFGMNINANSLNIILPVGISFYTFQTLSYTIDVYNKKLEPIQDFMAFSAFVCFFPQLVAGPIERATNLLPQFCTKRSFNYLKAVDGLRQILWGLFKKVVIADNCAIYSDMIFSNSENYSGIILVVGAIFFAFQIYGDFSGYSDIAIGTSRLFGFDLKQNFSAPYFSKNIVEFWRRWHISLGKWLTDYIFTPLALRLRHHEKKGIVISVLITFFVSGIWHGAGWNFIVFGLIHAIFYLITLTVLGYKKSFNTKSENKIIPSFNDVFKMFFTFVLTTFSYIFFRCKNLEHSLNYISEIFSKSLFSIPNGSDFINTGIHPFTITSLIIIFMMIEWNGREKKYAIEKLGVNWTSPFRYVLYYSIIVAIFWFSGNEQQFIYFQF